MLEILRKHPQALLPRRATSRSVGLDLHAFLLTESGRPNTAILSPRSTRMIPTGLIVRPPEGHAVFVCSRSGLAAERSIFVTNAPGVVDPDFRGEICVLLYNGGFESYYVKHEDRIGQLVVLPCPVMPFTEVTEMDLTERGEAGWGSTGR